MSTMLVGRTAIKAQRLRPGESAGFDVLADQFVQVIALHGTQAASLVAFSLGDHAERLSVSQTRARNNSIMLQRGMTLYSNRRNPLMELIEDSVGRHDLLQPMYSDPESDESKSNEPTGGAASLAAALGAHGVTVDDLPDPVNLFMKVGILQRGELEIQESLAEKNDSVLLRAFTDCLVGIVALPESYGGASTGVEPEVLIRIFQ